MKKNMLVIMTFCGLIAYSQKDYSLIYQSDSIIKSGVLLHDNGKYEEAIQKYKLVDDLDPNFYKAQSEIAVSLFGLKDNAKLEKHLGDLYASGEMEKFPDLYIKYGSYLDDVNQLEKANEVFRAGEKYLSNHANFMYNFAIHHIKNKKKQEAVNCLKKAILLNPNYASSHFMLGLVAFENGNISEGSLCLISYLVIAPDGRFAADALKMLSKKFGENYTEKGNLVFSTQDDDFTELTEILRNQFPFNKNYKVKSKIDDPVTRQIQAVVEYAANHKIKDGFFENYYLPWMQAVVEKNEVEALTYYTLIGFEKTLGKQLTTHKKKIEFFSQNFIPTFWKLFTTQKINFFGKEEKVTIIYNNYRPYLIGKLIDDKKEGKFLYVDEYGNKKGELQFKNNLLNGVQLYFNEKGNLQEEKSFSDDELNGLRKYYYETGNLSYTENYTNGKLNGLATTYYPNGGKQCEVNFKDDEKDGVLSCSYENGSAKSTLTYVNGKLEGKFTEFNEIGELTKKGSYKNEELDGEFIEYFDGKKLKSEVLYKDGKVASNAKEYYKNGALQLETFYSNGKKTKSIEYYRNGLLSEESFFSAEEDLDRLVFYNLLGEKFFEQKLKNGEIKSGLQYTYGSDKPVEINIAKKEFEIFSLEKNKYVTGEFSKGLKKGLWIYYHPNGNIKSKETYVNGKINGLQYNYDAYGNLTDIYNYVDGDLNGFSESYENDKVINSSYFTNDERSGPMTFYNLDGVVVRKDFMVEGDNLVSYHYNKNKSIHSKTNFIEKQVSKFENFDSNAKQESFVDFTNKNGKVSFTSNNKVLNYTVDLKNGIYNGLYEIKDKNNTVVSTTNYTNGVKFGITKAYNPNGKIAYDLNYYSGDLHGDIKYYDLMGNLRLSFTSVFGEVTGITKRYNVDKTVLNEVKEINDLKEGDYKWFNKKGKLVAAIHYVNNVPVYYLSMDKQGEVTVKTKIINQTAEVVSTYPNGKKAFGFSLKNGGVNGKIQIFNTEGLPEFYAEYKDNNLNGKRLEYHANGKVYKSEVFINSDYNGVVEYFSEDGKKVISAEYKNDNLEGLYQEFENGVLKISKKYINDELVEIIK